MFKHQGIWLPDGERHFPEWMTENGELVAGRGTYQIRKWRSCIPHIKRWRRAVDVGAHVGFWSIQMDNHFEAVDAFEPVEQFRDCWVANLAENNGTASHIELHDVALGNPSYPRTKGTVAETAREHVMMEIPSMGTGIDSGGTHVSDQEPDELDGTAVPLYGLDEFGYKDLDFIKIDCEGFEDEVIAGARETLAFCKPCVIVEQKPHKLHNFGRKGTPAVDILVGLGAVVRKEISGDYILSWA